MCTHTCIHRHMGTHEHRTYTKNTGMHVDIPTYTQAYGNLIKNVVFREVLAHVK